MNNNETFAKVFILSAVQGARNTETEIVCVIQRCCEYRATPKCADRNTFAKVS